MPSQLQTHSVQQEHISDMKYKSPVKRSSIQYQAQRFTNEKVSSLDEGRTVRLQDKGQPLNVSKQTEQTSPFENRHKPWPSRKVNGADEVVKYMSSVPNYLQHLEKVDVAQDKALNFGVVDWGRLEKWTYLQKQVTNRRAGCSPSTSSSSSSPFSNSGSSSNSDRSTDSPLSQRKKSPTLTTHQGSPPRGRQTRVMDEQSSMPVTTSPDSRTSQDKAPIRHDHKRGIVSVSDAKYISRNKSPSKEIASSSFTSKDNDMSKFSHNRVKDQIGKPTELENSEECKKQIVQNDLHLAESELSDRFSVVESMWDDVQESLYERHISYGSANSSRRSIEVNRRSISGIFTPSDIQIANPSPRISYSCPLSSSGGEPKSETVKLGRFTDDFPGKLSSQGEVKAAAAPKRDLSPHRLLRAGLSRIRSSSLREGSDNNHDDSSTSHRRGRRSSSPQRLLSAGLNLLRNSSSREGCSDNSHEDNASSNIKSRQSPLRRILDPLKSKNQIPFSGPVTSLPSHRAPGASNRDTIAIRDELRSANVVVNHSTSQITEAGCSVHAKKQVASTRQALLKLAWKNGFPLFVFSSSDINILVAALEKKTTPQNKDFECIYTIFTAHELKKKVGVWSSQGNKNKKHDLVYNVVGQINVSSSKSTGDSSKNYPLKREFLLYGCEQISTAHDRVSSLFRNELAAIVIQVQNERLEKDNHNKHSKESLPVEQKNENLSLASVVAIIPSGVHGTSSTGEPSPLIERWKSGGSCDCGGWDEGCMLTILTDKIQERSSTTSDGTFRIELFAQGETKETKHAFSMIAFKEGVYTVDFGASISSAQAFAMCIATLHSKNPSTISGMQCSVKAQSLEEHTATTYVPGHPPLSPVGRA
ncbi:uncharacterized protein A4U43_C07F970 [Asparagus officinalis]|uniref:Uncharacterized protein n=1 Tax=Asparagus officinalis TaxID=4686 RepID=A0A5P1E8B4_ASPOF|nr:uncharacterized protein LOC109848536 [Asparagus officinalis]ONK62156.1 uncharacterized protein A4U43_C07F970 [Asparagus officinalis]